MIIERKKLFWASCLALLVTGLSFGVRAGILNQLGVEFGLNSSELGVITATAFWGFPLAIVIGGAIVDAVGMKPLLVLAFVCHLVAILLTVIAQGFWSLFVSTLLIGIANGTVEAACNPLVATLYPENKTTRLNYFHLWFPGGIFLGTLIVFFFNMVNLSWQIQVGIMFLPTIIYGYLFYKLDFPVTERVASGYTNADMYKAILSPLFLFMFVCMFGTAVTELYTQQWIDVLLRNVTDNAILVLTITTGVMIIGRAFAEPVVHRLNPAGVLLCSAILATIGIYMLSTATAGTVFIAAFIFGLGVCYFWPTMIGFVAEYIPRSGALGLNLMGGIGMFAVSIYTMLMGGVYDELLVDYLPAGASLAAYSQAETGSAEAALLVEAKRMAGPEILRTTPLIPALLTVAFLGLNIYIRRSTRKTMRAEQLTD